MRILFFGDAEWATASLRLLVEDGHQIIGAVLRCHPSDSSLETTARMHEIPVLQPEKVNAPEFVAQVLSLAPDLNISVSYDQILRRPILDAASHGFINFHAGKLPFYRGRTVLNWAIINGETEIGITGHYVDEGIDTGDIILQRMIPVEWTDTYAEVLLKTTQLLPSVVIDTVRLIEKNQVIRQPQAHLPGTYFPQRGPGDEWLDWSDSSRNLYNKIRAITKPGPGARTLSGSEEVIVWKASYDPSWPTYKATPGQVVSAKANQGVMVKTGDATIFLEKIQVGDVEQVPMWRIGTRLGNNLYSALRTMQGKIEFLEGEIERLKNP